MAIKVLLVISLILPIGIAKGASHQQTQSIYREQGAAVFSSERGAMLWLDEGIKGRNCAICHWSNPAKPGKHVRTRKVIDPMALSVSPGRFTDPAKVEKWFKRNCKWTWGRECSAQEKGDLLEYLYQL